MEIDFHETRAHVLEDNKEEVGEIFRGARDARSRLKTLLGVDEFNSAGSTGVVIPNHGNTGREIQYFLDLFQAYSETGGMSSSDAKRRMRRFAENYQVAFEDVEQYLTSFGLEI